MALKLYTVVAPSTPTRVTTINTPVQQAFISCTSGGFSVGDKTLTTTNGFQVATGLTATLGTVNACSSFDLTELYVYSAAGNIAVLVIPL